MSAHSQKTEKTIVDTKRLAEIERRLADANEVIREITMGPRPHWEEICDGLEIQVFSKDMLSEEFRPYHNPTPPWSRAGQLHYRARADKSKRCPRYYEENGWRIQLTRPWSVWVPKELAGQITNRALVRFSHSLSDGHWFRNKFEAGDAITNADLSRLFSEWPDSKALFAAPYWEPGHWIDRSDSAAMDALHELLHEEQSKIRDEVRQAKEQIDTLRNPRGNSEFKDRAANLEGRILTLLEDAGIDWNDHHPR